MTMINSKAGIVELVTVLSNTITSGTIKVNPNDSPVLEDSFDAVIVGNQRPKRNDIGIVLLIGGDDKHAYYLGSITDVVQSARQSVPQANPGEILLASDDGQSGVKVNKDSINIGNKNTSITSSPTKLNIQQGKGSFELSNNKCRLVSGKSSVIISDASSSFETIGDLNLTSGKGLFLGTKGNVIITSGIYNSDESDLFKAHGAVNKFLLKAKEAKFNVSGPMIFDAGSFTMNVCSGKMVGGEMPGKGASQTFKLSVVQGELAFSTGSGDINISSLGIQNYIKLYTGQSPESPPSSKIQIDRKKIIIKQDTGMSSNIELTKGEINANADKKIKLNCTMDIEIIAKKKITIDATSDMEIKTNTKMKLNGKTEIAMDTAILKLEDCRQIKAGNKAVQPTGQGPFCAIPQCIISGSNHTGPTAMG